MAALASGASPNKGGHSSAAQLGRDAPAGSALETDAFGQRYRSPSLVLSGT